MAMANGLGLGLPYAAGRTAASVGGSPNLNFNFLTGSGVDTVGGQTLTVTAANGTYFNSAGVLTAAASNTLRFDHDPVTLAPRGILIEEQRTNLLLHSADLTNGAWAKTDTTVTADVLPAPDGTASMDRVTEGVAGTAILTQEATISAGATVTGSIFLRRGNHDWVAISCYTTVGVNGGMAYLNLATGVIGSVINLGAGTNTTATVQAIGSSGVYRVTITTTTATETNCRLQTRSASADGSTTRVNNGERYHWGSQLEVGAFPTSYIPTAGSQVTRTADSITLATGAWFNQAAGTMWAEYSRIWAGAGSSRVAVLHQDTDYFHALVASNALATQGGYGATYTGGVAADLIPNLPVPAAGAVTRVAHAYATDSFAGASRGVLGTDSSGALPTPTGLHLGHFGGALHLNGHLRGFTYWPSRLPNAAVLNLAP